MQAQSNNTFDSLPDITAMEDRVYSHDFWTKWHRSTANELIFIMNGSMRLAFNDESYQIFPGDISLLPANTVHREEFSDKINLDTFFVHFHWKHHEQFFKVVNNNNIKHLSPDVRFEVHTIINSLRAITNLRNDNRLLAQARLNLLLTIIYCDIERHSSSLVEQESAKRQCLIRQAKSYMNANFSKNISLDDVADYLKVSKFYISRVFKSETNLSLFEYLNDYRMRIALQLLQEGRLYISEIAEQTGFSDRKYFSKVFRKFYGEAPTKYSKVQQTKSVR